MTPAHRDVSPDAPVPASSSAEIQRPRVGILGLGLMGSAFADRLLRTGHEVLVWNRTREKADALVEAGARWTDRPLRDCDTVLVCLYTDGVVRSVLESMRADGRPGLEIIDTTTGDPETACVMAAELEACGVSYQEAPVSGSSAQARDGLATVFVGGTSGAFERQSTLWPMLGTRVLHCGPCGNASRLKLITNLVIGLNRLALAEGLTYAEAIVVDLGLMPVASLSVSKSPLGDAYTSTLGGDCSARFTAALMLGAAVGCTVLGGLGDRLVRRRALRRPRWLLSKDRCRLRDGLSSGHRCHPLGSGHDRS